jgi:dUTP pyrophosphatase
MTHGNTDSTGPAHDNVAGPRAVPVPVRRLDTGLPLPAYAHAGDAGADLYSRVDVTLAPGERSLVPTGLALELPEGYAAFTHPRSGLAARHGISIVNAPGTIDAGYRGEILVNLVNLDARESFVVRRGDRIAQMVVQRVERAQFLEVDSLAGSERGETGHGASGGFLSNRADETADPTTDETVSETADQTADRTTDHRKG